MGAIELCDKVCEKGLEAGELGKVGGRTADVEGCRDWAVGEVSCDCIAPVVCVECDSDSLTDLSLSPILAKYTRLLLKK